MGKIEWAMWANEQALVSAFVAILGGAVGIAGQFSRWPIGVYTIIVGLLVLVIEYPRGQREKGKTTERRFQLTLSKFHNSCGVLIRSYYIRFVFYLIIGVPCCFILATLLGGMSFFITSAIYFVSALKGEEWKPCGIEKTNSDANILHPPSRPPPRAPGTPRLAENRL